MTFRAVAATGARVNALRALRSFPAPEKAEDAYTALGTALSSTDHHLQREALALAGGWKVERALPAIRGMLTQSDRPDLQADALAALVAIAPLKSRGAIEDFASSKSWRLRAAAAQALGRLAGVVFTSGGVGPTHDDKTLPAMALAVGRTLVRHPEIEQTLRHHYGESITEAALTMADVPEGTVLAVMLGTGGPEICWIVKSELVDSKVATWPPNEPRQHWSTHALLAPLHTPWKLNLSSPPCGAQMQLQLGRVPL